MLHSRSAALFNESSVGCSVMSIIALERERHETAALSGCTDHCFPFAYLRKCLMQVQRRELRVRSQGMSGHDIFIFAHGAFVVVHKDVP